MRSFLQFGVAVSFIGFAIGVLKNRSKISKLTDSYNDLKKNHLDLIQKMSSEDCSLENLNLNFCKEITDCLSNKKDLQSAYDSLKTILNYSPDLILIKDSHLRLIYANPSALKIKNQSLEEVIGKTAIDLFGDEGKVFFEKDLGVIKSKKPQHIEEEITVQGYGKKTFLSNKFPLKDLEGKIIGLVCIAKDITERKKLEKELKRSEEKYRKLFELLPIDVQVWDVFYNEKKEVQSSTLSEANPKALKTWGKTLKEVQGKTLNEIFSDHSMTDYYRSTIELMMKKNNVNEIEGYFEPLDLYHRSISIPFGEKFINTIIDITQLKKATLLAQQQNLQLSAIFQSVSHGIIVFDMKGNLILQNQSLEKILYHRRDDLLSQSLHELSEIFLVQTSNGAKISPEDWPVSKVLKGQSIKNSTIKAIHKKTGKELHLNLSGEPIFGPDKKQTHALMIVVDITQEINQKKRLRESGALFSALVNNIPQHAWMCNSHSITIWYNEKFFSYTQVPLEKLQTQGWAILLHPNYCESALKKWLRHFNQGLPWEDTLPLRAHDGTYRWFLCRAHPIMDLTGNITQWFGTNTDVTDQLLLQEKLEKAIQARAEFLSIASHELKTPLTSLKIQNQLLFSDLKAKPNSTYSHQQVLSIAIRTEKQINRLQGLVDDMLDIARIRSGNLPLKKQPMSLSDLVYEISERMNPQFIQAGAPIPKLHLCLSAWGNWDKLRLDQVISNLLINAIRYGNKKPVRIELKSDEKTCHLIVEDHGIGIPEEKQNSIFNPFERTIDADSVSGLGLGLFITQAIVLAHQGRISVKSTPGTGSTFTIELPQHVPLFDPTERPDHVF